MKFVDGNHWECGGGGGGVREGPKAGGGGWWVGGDMKKLLPSFSFLMIFSVPKERNWEKQTRRPIGQARQ